MTIDKLPSGKYRIRQMSDGKVYHLTVDHRPSNAEAVRLMAGEIERNPKKSPLNMTFYEAGQQYIEAKSNILSPSTRRLYLTYLEEIPEDLSEKKVNQVTSFFIQKIVNGYSVGRSPKTVANMSAFIIAILKSVDVDVKRPQLPQKEKKPVHIPSEEDISKVFALIKGGPYEIPLTLCALGMRRSEVCAATLQDLNGNVLTINKALVQDADKNWVIKTTKTVDSTRTIIIPDYLADMIREQGYIYKGYPGVLRNALIRYEKAAGVERFTLHKLRHFFASYAHQRGFTDKQIQAAGGWKTDNVLKTVYQHALDMENAKKGMSDAISSLF